jgi:hypothetical protein
MVADACMHAVGRDAYKALGAEGAGGAGLPAWRGKKRGRREPQRAPQPAGTLTGILLRHSTAIWSQAYPSALQARSCCTTAAPSASWSAAAIILTDSLPWWPRVLRPGTNLWEVGRLHPHTYVDRRRRRVMHILSPIRLPSMGCKMVVFHWPGDLIRKSSGSIPGAVDTAKYRGRHQVPSTKQHPHAIRGPHYHAACSAAAPGLSNSELLTAGCGCRLRL